MKQLELPNTWFGLTDFFVSLHPVQKKVYEAYFKNPTASRSQLATIAGCGATSVDDFLKLPGLKDETKKILEDAMAAPEMLEVWMAAVKSAKTPNGHQDRKLLFKAMGIVGEKKETVVNNNNINGLTSETAEAIHNKVFGKSE